MEKRLYILSALLLCLVLSGCPDTTTPTNTVNGFTGSIYYSNGNFVYRMELSKQVVTQLFRFVEDPDITANGEILCRELSPARLIYSDITGANRKLLLVDENNSGPIHQREITHPRISYNQKYVVYESRRYRQDRESYVIDAVTGALVTRIGDNSKSQSLISPSWAPDGSIIVQGGFPTNNGIYKVSADFSTTTRIDPNLTNVSEPSVSPDGSTIAFIRDSQLYTMGIDGTNPLQLYTSNLQFSIPTWSPDSKYIAAVSKGIIYIFDVKNKTATQITTSHFVGDLSQLSWR
ncbi:MAG: PD40 domain-containing protein [Ignavibacteria bacterium]|nr:PD40 domain-containing protein [Ignavibacteria bacterium]